jgi:peroxiredoxin
VLVPALPPALPGVALVGGAPALLPAEPAVLPPVCAHDTLATPTSAAATAAVIVLTITVESPWSVEENCIARRAKKVPSRL